MASTVLISLLLHKPPPAQLSREETEMRNH